MQDTSTDEEQCALVRQASFWRGTLLAGELIFIPAGCPHQVQNLEATLAVAMNFVDGANVARFVAEMRRKAALAPRGESGGDYYASLAARLTADQHAFPTAAQLRDAMDAGVWVEPQPMLYTQWKAHPPAPFV